MSRSRDQALGFTPSSARPLFRRPSPSFDAPPADTPRTDRDIGLDDSKELAVKTGFAIASGGAWGTFSTEQLVASLARPHNAVDVFLSLTSPQTLTNVSTTNGILEVAATVYAWAGGARAAVARGAYLVDVASPSTVEQSLYLCGARVAGERFDVSLRVAGAFTDNGGVLQGTLGVVGYETGSPNVRKPRLAFQAARAANLFGGTTVARAAWLHGAIVTNPNATGTYLQLFDNSSTGQVPGGAFIADATPALASIYIPGNTSGVLSFNDEPIDFQSGIVWQSSSSPGTMTTASSQTLAVQLKYG